MVSTVNETMLRSSAARNSQRNSQRNERRSATQPASADPIVRSRLTETAAASEALLGSLPFAKGGDRAAAHNSALVVARANRVLRDQLALSLIHI